MVELKNTSSVSFCDKTRPSAKASYRMITRGLTKGGGGKLVNSVSCGMETHVSTQWRFGSHPRFAVRARSSPFANWRKANTRTKNARGIISQEMHRDRPGLNHLAGWFVKIQ